MSEQHNDGKWHLDRNVPLALIIAIAIQTAAGVWWASSISERVNTLEREAIRNAPQADRIVRLETTMEIIVRGVERIERAISQIKPAQQ